MKSISSVGVWRPLMGVVIMGGMALGVTAIAAPRAADPASRSGKGAVGTEVTNLVTGDAAQINSVVAGTPPTAVIQIIPSPPPPAYAGSYPASCSISDNVLSCDAGGFRAWFDWQAGRWDPMGNGTTPDHPGTVQMTIDAMGFMGSLANPSKPGGDLAYPAIPCSANATCTAAFGESWAKCDAPIVVPRLCVPSYADKGGVNPGGSYCDDFGSGTCNQADCNTASINNSCFAITEVPRPDDGTMKYYASTVIDIPANAKGRYVVDLDVSNSFLASSTAPPVQLPLLTARGFVVEIKTGSCCSDLSVTPAVCEDGLTKAQCGDDETPPFVWTYNKLCAAGCVECINDAGCNDNDACTTETCNTAIGVCVRGFRAGFNPGPGGKTGNCCNVATGALTNKDDGDACTDDFCSEPNNRGSAQHVPEVAPCDDGNPCTTADTCDGTNTEAAGGCTGTDINSFPCPSGDVAECPAGAQSCTDGLCVCTLTPKVTFEINSPAPKTCAGSPVPGVNGTPCAKDTDCQGGFCDLYANGANCFDGGDKVTARVRIGAAASPINGGQFLIYYDPSCLKYNSAVCLAPYTATVVAPAANPAAGTIFIACGVDPFGGVDGPLGGVDIVSINFTKVGECNECELAMGGFGPGFNPLNSYLVDDNGWAVNIESQPKGLQAKGELVLNVPDNVKVNSDCDVPAATVSWADHGGGPNASFSCPDDVNLECRGAHENGLQYSQSVVLNGGTLPQGFSSFCCYAYAKDKCDEAAGCTGRVNDCAGTPKPDGCWTVEVSDETTMDIHIQLEPPIAVNELTRCIEFCLYGACTEEPQCFTEDVVFGGLYNYVGKAGGDIKVPKGKWGCITAQDQIHSLRSCDSSPDCIDGTLIARFKGDPIYGGNWLIGGNLDGWKKDDPKASLDVIDILDFGQFISQFGVCYTTYYGCHEGPHADINGDGCVTAADYNFITRNMLVSSKDCCCGPQAAAQAPALTEVSVDELRQMGLDDLIVADLNGDGLVNAEDMDAFSQGVRPVKSHDRKGVKGLRSGR